MIIPTIRVLGFALLLGAAVEACTIPVFRFALDRWHADAYRLDAPATWIESPAGKALEKLLNETQSELEMVPVGPSEPARLVMPGNHEKVVWTGTLGEDETSLLLSPAREELARRILRGESMVWVLVRSGDPEKDTAFEERMKARLKYLETVAAIPEQDPNDPDSQLGPGPELRVGFSLITLDRKDPAEAAFLKMLSGPEGPELLDGEEPFAGVVFGRGRVLGAWDSDSLDDEGIDEITLFLLGACSCRVKFQNPGWDLAMAVDWDARLLAAQMVADNKSEEGEESTEEAASVPVAAPAPPVEPEVVTFGDEPYAITTSETRVVKIDPVLIAGVLAGIVGVVVAICLAVRKGH